MKKLAKNVPLCTAILIIVAVLAVPLLGGLKLSTAYNSATKRFEKALSTPIEKIDTDVFSNTQAMINAAETLLEKGLQLRSDSGVVEKRAEQLREAIDACASEKGAVDRYLTGMRLYSAADLFYQAFDSESQASLNKDRYRVDYEYSRIKNIYRDNYAEYTQTTNNLLTGFPAAQLASLFNIGGGK